MARGRNGSRSAITLNEEGVPMWQSLKRADIERARSEIELRRAATLKRHAEERGRLESDEGELAALDRLIEDFADKYEKFMRPPIGPAAAKAAVEPVAAKIAVEPVAAKKVAAPKVAAEPVAAKIAAEPPAPKIAVEAVAAKVAVHRRAPEPRRFERRDFPRTNFEAFARAVARTGP
jgi:hypothetical protein